ncbi:hypothetical protein ACTG16_22910 [Aeromonas sp. 23P]|uniref:hypothetical protein n=1 Tax=Aeromonas sp. 23P TaxID=3452716 RepID=UPI003F79C64B
MSDGKELEAIRWATTDRNYDPVWGKWHLIVPGTAFTECGQVVRLFEADGSPQFGPVSKVSCKRCLKKMNRG